MREGRVDLIRAKAELCSTEHTEGGMAEEWERKGGKVKSERRKKEVSGQENDS